MNRQEISKQIIDLRIVDDLVDRSLLDLKIAFSGTISQCNKHAQRNNWKWMKDFDSIFGGYFYNPKTGDCFLPS